MVPFYRLATSSVGKKIMTGVTGIALSGFVISHLIGNLLLFVGSDAFNQYTYKLMQMGTILYVLEGGLVVAFLIHAFTGMQIAINKRRARPQSYVKTGNAGGVSRKSIASLSMIYTGVLLFVFVVLHLKTFKFGPYYETVVGGVVMRDLYRLVMEVFRDPVYVMSYTAIMILLGVHLRHGFWSAFQSLGVNHPRYSPIIYGVGILVAVVVSVGFVVMPAWIYFAKPI